MAEANDPLKQQDFLAPLKQYVPTETLARKRDKLSGRYQIQLNQPLPELNSAFAKAYAATDTEAPGAPLYALVFDNALGVRQKNIAALRGFRHPAMVALLDDGVVEISTISESRYVTILEKPVGQPVSKLLSQDKNPVPEAIIISYMMRPLVELLGALSAMGISHNRINLDTVYLSKNSIMLGECISEPSGFSQHPVFEPIDHLLTSPWAKPDFAIGTDCYALAMLVLHLALGFQPFTALDKESLINEILAKGTYHTFVIQWEFSEVLQDFFRSLLNDVYRERWIPANIESWLTGRRFNLILPSIPHETSRGFEFTEHSYLNCKSLAHAMHMHWQEARTLLSDNKLTRWLDANVHKHDMAETITRLISAAGDGTRSERYYDELVARVIMILDPAGPIRLKNLSVAVDGAGLFFAYAFLSGEQETLQTTTHIIESDISSFWIEQQKGAGDYTAALTRLQKIKGYMRINGLGFGPERCLYEFYPDLPCLSPLIRQYYASTPAEALIALDAVAAQNAAREMPMDRHIAAFIASKVRITKEIRIREIDNVPGLSTHPKMIALKLLVQAQGKAKDSINLKGLSCWVAFSLFPLLDTIHKRSSRRKLQSQLHEEALKGSLNALADLLFNPDFFVADYTSFQKAKDLYADRKLHIATLKNHVYLTRHSRMAGRGIAQSVAYIICFTTIYFTLRSYFHFL